MMRCLLWCAAACLFLVGGGAARDVNVAFECAVREYAYEYAEQLQGWRGAEKMKEVFDGLELATMCNKTFEGKGLARTEAPRFAIPSEGVVLFVDAEAGRDEGSGTEGAPLRTVEGALVAMRKARRGRGGQVEGTIVLRGGVHYLKETLRMTGEDSNLTVMNYPGERAAVSGAVPLRTTWKRHGTVGNVYVADIKGQVDDVPGLRVGGRRGARASYPNRDPELTYFPDGWVSDSKTKWTAPRAPKNPVQYVTLEEPHLTDKTMFTNYMVGINGTCEVFDPPVSYWCSETPSGGGAFSYRIPSGMTAPPKTLKKYQNPKGAIITTWRPEHWAVWMFEVDSYDAATDTFGWTKGGFQGARGHNEGSDWFIENVIEELDSPNEYFFDRETGQLYYYYNGTGAPPADLQFEATKLKTLVSVVGTQKEPVRGHRYKGVTFRDTAYTYMDPHGVPSGGDWALQRSAALFFEGTEDVLVDSCLVTRVDGNAVMLSGYNRGAVLQRNEFVWIGDNVMAAWGYTAPYGSKDKVLGQYKMGVDGSGGEQPRGTKVLYNFIHELGLFEKQSSPWFQSKAAETVLKGNIGFNMPRAGINFNDGFGGGNEVTENLLWNTCRESGDHANFNSWDRQPYLSDVLNGTRQFTPAYNHIHRNFFIGNYHAVNTVDNDDGSSWYRIYDNFLVYGGHKSNFGGHNKYSYNNINAFAEVYQDGLCFRGNAQNLKNATDGYWNNTCIQDKEGLVAYQFNYCDIHNLENSSLPIMHDNKIYNPDATIRITCAKDNLSEEQLQAAGYDLGTKAFKTPAYDQIVAWAKSLLGKPTARF